MVLVELEDEQPDSASNATDPTANNFTVAVIFMRFLLFIVRGQPDRLHSYLFAPSGHGETLHH